MIFSIARGSWWLGVVAGALVLAAEGARADAALSSLVPEGSAAAKVMGDCKFTEGPAYSPRGFLLFSDIPNDRIVRWNADGTSSDFLKPSNKANGLAFDAAGNLYACQGEARRVVLIGSQDGKIEPLCDQYEGKPFNAPNDLAIDGHGGLYFTDPSYGPPGSTRQPMMAVYYINAEGVTRRVIDSMERPNGVVISPDGKSLYVAEPNKSQLHRFPVTGPGMAGAGQLIFTGDKDRDGGGPDGMAIDKDGNIYATYAGIVVLNPDGKLIGRVPVPERPANCKFGGVDGKTLFITARTSLYSLATNTTSAPLPARGPRAPVSVSMKRSKLSVPVRFAADEKDAAVAVEVKDITLKVPKSWKQAPPSNKLRLAQFSIPAVEGDAEPAELVVSFFEGDGGGIKPNIERWVGQFQRPERTVKVTQGESAAGQYVFSNIAGTYDKPIGPPIAGRKQPTPGQRSLGVILVVKEKGNYFLKLTGADKTVAAAEAALRSSFGGDAAKETPFNLE